MQNNIQIETANYHKEEHQKDVVFLLNKYACDPMGGGKQLSEFAQQNLVAQLAKLTQAFSILIYVNGKPAALANCFEGFSTFKAMPLINIHDLFVCPEYRGIGLSQMLLQKIEDIAKSKLCCKITLEVLSNNDIAKAAYQTFGFSGYELDQSAGHALFWEKAL